MESFISLLSKRNFEMMSLLSINIVTHYLKQSKLYIKRYYWTWYSKGLVPKKADPVVETILKQFFNNHSFSIFLLGNIKHECYFHSNYLARCLKNIFWWIVQWIQKIHHSFSVWRRTVENYTSWIIILKLEFKIL